RPQKPFRCARGCSCSRESIICVGISGVPRSTPSDISSLSIVNGTFSEVKEAMFAHMPSLQLLLLNSNSATAVRDDAFSGSRIWSTCKGSSRFQSLRFGSGPFLLCRHLLPSGGQRAERPHCSLTPATNLHLKSGSCALDTGQKKHLATKSSNIVYFVQSQVHRREPDRDGVQTRLQRTQGPDSPVAGKQQHQVAAQGAFLRPGLADRTVSWSSCVSPSPPASLLHLLHLSFTSCVSPSPPASLLHLLRLQGLRGNAFQCDCGAKWLMTWLKSTNATVSNVACAG
ncbi:unnamed protein product, partial [Tetraodon nigroviridis]